MNDSVLTCAGLSKCFRDGGSAVTVLKGLDFRLRVQETMAIVGVSGSGKSTLLNLLGGLDEPDSGSVTINGVGWHPLSAQSRCELRNRSLGFVYQSHHLLADFNAWENVAMPLRIAGFSVGEANRCALEWLARLGLADRSEHRPSQLSGGERQRVAIARALVREPAVVLMDEPTGNLDSGSAARVLDTLSALSDLTTAFVIVTHDHSVAARADRILRLQDGILVPER